MEDSVTAKKPLPCAGNPLFEDLDDKTKKA
jgi:hypothetical protein